MGCPCPSSSDLALLYRLQYVDVTISRNPGQTSGVEEQRPPSDHIKKGPGRISQREGQLNDSSNSPKKSFVVILCGSTELDLVDPTLLFKFIGFSHPSKRLYSIQPF